MNIEEFKIALAEWAIAKMFAMDEEIYEVLTK